MRIAEKEWIVGPEDAGVRLDTYLAAPERAGSRGRAGSALERGKVIVNGEDVGPGDAARRLSPGDLVHLWMDRPGSARSRRVARIPGLRVVYEDDVLYVIDKPAGLLTVPLPRRDGAPSVYHLLERHLRPRGKRRPFVVHRIDRDTSGLVVFAKDETTQLHIKTQFRRREPERIYLAVVHGHPDPPEGMWRDYVAWDAEHVIQKQTHARDPKGTQATSAYRVIEPFRRASLVEVRLRTGKQNQIRLQAGLRGYPLVGERRYVSALPHPGLIDFPRQALHAHRLAFAHPRDGRALTFEAPLPVDMRALVTRLRRDDSPEVRAV
ncbi:MAG: RluA family pseudouridine synthase [Vicinamibacterales bacterium]